MAHRLCWVAKQQQLRSARTLLPGRQQRKELSYQRGFDCIQYRLISGRLFIIHDPSRAPFLLSIRRRFEETLSQQRQKVFPLAAKERAGLEEAIPEQGGRQRDRDEEPDLTLWDGAWGRWMELSKSRSRRGEANSEQVERAAIRSTKAINS
jgi:hypothetical protein